MKAWWCAGWDSNSRPVPDTVCGNSRESGTPAFWRCRLQPAAPPCRRDPVRGGQLQAAQPCRSHTRACQGNCTDHTAAAAEKEEGAPSKGVLRRRLNWLVTRRQRRGTLPRHMECTPAVGQFGDSDRPAEPGPGTGLFRQFGPTDVAPGDHHSVSASTRRPAAARKASSVTPITSHARFIASVTSSCAAAYTSFRDRRPCEAGRSARSKMSSGMDTAVFIPEA